MPDLLLELFSEEIPARMQQQAAKDLERLVVGALSDRGLLFEGARGFAGPRRLTLALSGLPAKQPDVSEEKKGPRVGAPEKAIEGFLKSAGVTLDQCQKQSDAKGEFYVAVIQRKGRDTRDVLAEVLPETIAKLPWPKSMRWGEGSFRWVRPLHSIVATFDGEVVPFTVPGILSSPASGGGAREAGGGGLASGNTTYGHRFLSSGKIEVRRFEDYEQKLRAAHVVLDGAERRETILHDAKQKAFALGLELIEDEGLANEVMGLAEWPTVLIGTIDLAFMDVPPEILQTSMRTHQKYFALRDPKTGKLANRFVLVSNMAAEDGGKQIVAGNERVLRARLSDAKFFWDQDRKVKLADRVDALKDIVFHAKLGTQFERVKRIELLAGEIAKIIGTRLNETVRNKLVEKAKLAALLCKADLTTGVVGEFPELQGVMGRYYALSDSEDNEIASAIRDHYRPLGPSDEVPSGLVSIAVGLADKLDTLVGFFAVGEKPTGSGDPYALRRAALGIIRLLLTNQVRTHLSVLLSSALLNVVKTYDRAKLMDLVTAAETGPYSDNFFTFVQGLVRFFDNTPWKPIFEKRLQPGQLKKLHDDGDLVLNYGDKRLGQFLTETRKLLDLLDQLTFPDNNDNKYDRLDWEKAVERAETEALIAFADVSPDILSFFADRLKVALREKGIRHDLIDAVFALGNEDDLVRLVRRVEALQAFLKTDDGANLLTGYRRAANILKIERKKEKNEAAFSEAVDAVALQQDEEKALVAALSSAKIEAAAALAKEDFAAAMGALAKLRVPVDRFFDKVTVNADDKALRENRLKLLSQIVETAHQVADFSKVEG